MLLARLDSGRGPPIQAGQGGYLVAAGEVEGGWLFNLPMQAGDGGKMGAGWRMLAEARRTAPA